MFHTALTDATYQMEYKLSYSGAALTDACETPYLDKLSALKDDIAGNLQGNCDAIINSPTDDEPDVLITVTIDSVVAGEFIAITNQVVTY